MAITPTSTSASVPTSVEPDTDQYAVTVTGGSGLIVIQLNNHSAQGLEMVVRNATAATTLTLTTTLSSGTGFTNVLGIAIDGLGTATITAPTVNLTGNITVGGPLAALTLNNWIGGTLTAGTSATVLTSITGNVLAGDTITLGTELAKLTANQVTGQAGAGGLGTITASSFGAITVNSTKNKAGVVTSGNFFANLVNTNTAASTALSSATIAGALTGSWNLAGSVGTVSAATTNDWTLGRPSGPGIANGGLLGNVGTLTLGTATNVAIYAPTGVVGAISAISLNDSNTDGTLYALAFGTITTTGAKNTDNGNFIANLTAIGAVSKTGALGTLQVAGNLGSAAVPTALLFTLGSVGSITASDTVESVTITAVASPVGGGAITTLGAAAWDQSNVTAVSVGTWKIVANLPALLLGNFTQSTVTLSGNAASTTATLGTFSAAGTVDQSTFVIVHGSVTSFTVGGALTNDIVNLQSATATGLGTISAADWTNDVVTAPAIGTLRSTGRPAAALATSGLLGNIAESTIDVFGGNLNTLQAAGNLTTTGAGYLLVNGSIGTVSVGRAVSDFQVATDLNGGTGGIGSLTAGQWLDTDLAAFAIGSITTLGFVTPDLLPGFTNADFTGSDVAINGFAVVKGVTNGIGSISIGNNLDGDVFNVPYGIGALTVTGTIGSTGETSLDLLNPLSLTDGLLGSLSAGAIGTLTLDANQSGAIAVKGNAAQHLLGNVGFLTLAIGYAGGGAGATGLAGLSVAGSINSATIDVKEGIGSFTVVGALSSPTVAAAYDNPLATIPTLSVGSWNGGTLVANSIGTFTVTGSLGDTHMTLLGAKGTTALNTFTAGGAVNQLQLQVTSGNVGTFQCASFINSGLLVGYRLVDPLVINDPLNNGNGGTTGNWEGNFTLGSFKTTAPFKSALPATASFQSSDIVAGTLGSAGVVLTGVNPTATIPSTVDINGVDVTVPQILEEMATFGVAFRVRNTGGSGKLTVAGQTKTFTTGFPTTPTIGPSFYYIGLQG